MKAKHIKTIAFTIFFALIGILVVATVFEKINGSEQVHEFIYGSWWFVALWAIFGIVSLTYIFQQKLYLRVPAFLLHISFGLILTGALVTFLTAERGYIHLRQGETRHAYSAEKEGSEQALPFELKLILFDIEYHAGSGEPADFISFLKVDDEMCRVSMNKIYRHRGYRFYQMDYDPDEMGTVLLVSHDPWGIGVTYAGYALLALSMCWLLWRRIGWKGLLCTVIPTAGVWLYISQLNPMTPVLRTPLLAAHVSVIMVAYALFVFMMITGIVGLCASKQSMRLYRWNSKLLYPALFLLAAGIFIGAVWANISWGRYWGWDAKETWALITMLVYALPFHRKSIAFFRSPKKFHLYCVLASLAVGMTFFGVTYLLGGIHSYV